MHEHGLATLVTLGSDGLAANHIPLIYDPEPAPWGTLRGHVARSNQVWQDFSPDVEALAIFQGAQRYITPNWYLTRTEGGNVVPTFNYQVVHGYGRLNIIQDPAWLRSLVGQLTDRYEADQAAPWSVSDAPEAFIAAQIKAIVGIEIPLTRILAKWKVSQNRPTADRIGVVKGLRDAGGPDSLAMANWVEDALDSSNASDG